VDSRARQKFASALAIVACLNIAAHAAQQFPPVQEAPDAPRPDVPQLVPAPLVINRPVLKPGINPNPMAEMPDFARRRQQAQLVMLESLSSDRLEKVRIGAATQALVAQLDDPSFQVREAASKSLRALTIDDAEVWALLDRRQLSPEAHERLLNVARQRANEKPRGALGVRMGNSPMTRPGVLVQGTLPDMPADKILKVGDVIERLDGVQLNDSNDLAEGLQMRAPGHEVKLSVLRTERDAQGRPLLGPDGKQVERRLDFTVALGDAENLDRFDAQEARAMGNANMNRNNLPLQQRAWQISAIMQRFSLRPAAAVIPEPIKNLAQPAKSSTTDDQSN